MSEVSNLKLKLNTMDKDGLDFDRFRDSEVCGPIHRTEILFVSVCPFSLTSHTKQTLIHVVWHLCGRGTCFIVRLRAAVLRKKKSQIEFKLFEETPLNYPWEMCLLCCFEHKLKTSLNKIVFKPFFLLFYLLVRLQNSDVSHLFTRDEGDFCSRMNHAEYLESFQTRHVIVAAARLSLPPHWNKKAAVHLPPHCT